MNEEQLAKEVFDPSVSDLEYAQRRMDEYLLKQIQASRPKKVLIVGAVDHCAERVARMVMALEQVGIAAEYIPADNLEARKEELPPMVVFDEVAPPKNMAELVKPFLTAKAHRQEASEPKRAPWESERPHNPKKIQPRRSRK